MTHLARLPVPPVAHLDGVSQHYGKTVALNNITLDIPARCMVGLIGPDGTDIIITTFLYFEFPNGILTTC